MSRFESVFSWPKGRRGRIDLTFSLFAQQKAERPIAQNRPRAKMRSRVSSGEVGGDLDLEWSLLIGLDFEPWSQFAFVFGSVSKTDFDCESICDETIGSDWPDFTSAFIIYIFASINEKLRFKETILFKHSNKSMYL